MKIDKPTITDFINAQHDHSSAEQGGLIVIAGAELTTNKQDSLAIDGTGLKYPTVDAVNDALALKANQDGTILYYSVKWFTPSSTVSNVGATVTSVGTQFTSAMVGAKLIINGEQRIIQSYTSTTEVVVNSAYSNNYSGVVAGSWGVYNKAEEVKNDGIIYFYPYNSDANILEINSINNWVKAGFIKLLTDGSASIDNVNSVFMYGSIFGQNNTRFVISDVGFRRNAIGLYEVYDGANADGLLANRRDLLLRNLQANLLLINGASPNGVDVIQAVGTISASPATLSNQVVVKSQLSTQIEIGANSNVLDAWMDNEVIFTASCTITVPSTLPTNFNFNWLTLAGVTVTWATTAPHTWLFGTPANATEKTYGRVVKRGSTNSIIML